MRPGLLLAALIAATPTLASAQVVDSARADSLRRDSLRADSVVAAQYRAAQARTGIRVTPLPRVGQDGPLPAGSRLVLTRDSMEWANAETVADLLTRVTGVYVWRGGWVGRPEMINYQGRGSTSVEYYLDGLPYLPAGLDSVAVDASLFAVSLLDRIEVERWPGLLRVWLYSRRHERLAARSRLSFSKGDGDFTRYQGSLERPSETGVGFGLAADYLNAAPSAATPTDRYRNTQIWAQATYFPSPTLGFQAQLLRSKPDRGPVLVGGNIVSAPVDARRSDLQLRGTLGRRDALFGSRLDLFYARTSWSDADIEQGIGQLGAIASHRTPTLSASLSAFHRTRWTPLDLRATAAWAPAPHLVGTLEGGYQRHDAGRASRWVAGRAAVTLPHDFVLGGAARVGRIVTAPAIDLRESQAIADFQTTLSWDRPRLGFELGYARTRAFQPEGYQPFLLVPVTHPQEAHHWLTASGRISPLSWMTVESWFSTPRPLTAQGQPPAHAVTRGTIRSKFLRAFPSGAFDLKLQLSVERFSNGTIGFRADGAPITIPAAVFMRSLIELRLGTFSVYWDRSNLTSTSATYVPGYTIPALSSTFGVRWEFTN